MDSDIREHEGAEAASALVRIIAGAGWADAAAQLAERWGLDEDLDEDLADEEGYPRR
ncbi:MAG: hypothetical protein ACRDZQ_11640 [Acidimicrobiales bacterium]